MICNNNFWTNLLNNIFECSLENGSKNIKFKSDIIIIEGTENKDICLRFSY